MPLLLVSTGTPDATARFQLALLTLWIPQSHALMVHLVAAGLSGVLAQKQLLLQMGMLLMDMRLHPVKQLKSLWCMHPRPALPRRLLATSRQRALSMKCSQRCAELNPHVAGHPFLHCHMSASALSLHLTWNLLILICSTLCMMLAQLLQLSQGHCNPVAQQAFTCMRGLLEQCITLAGALIQ